jgi:hypothetical protein
MLTAKFAFLKTAEDLKESGYGVKFGFRLSKFLCKSAASESASEEEK